ncbi:MAG: S-layer homology domain-containing protein [Clostridia bacterium]|nr:S-layer homology domain-containing protein [Clostridia bacterium]
MKLKKACVLISCIFMFISCITGYAFSVDTFSLDDAITVGTGGNKLTVSAQLGGEALPPAGDLMIIILNKDVQFASLTTDEQILANAKYVDFINNLQNRTEVSYSYTPYEWEDGSYAVRITFSYALTKTYHEYYTLKIVNPQTIIDCIADLSTVGFSEAGTKLDLYINENEYINMGEVPEYYTASENIGTSFVYARELRKNGAITGNAEDFAEPDDVVDTMKAAIVLDAAMYGNSTRLQTLAAKYGSFFTGLIPENTSYDSIFATVSGAAPYPEEITQFWNEIRQCVIFAHMYNGTYQNVINVIENYGSSLGVDMSYLSGNNVTVSEVAPKISRTNVVQYINTFPSAVKSAADEVIAGRKTQKPSVITGGGNGGGGGSAGVIKYDSLVVTPEEESDNVTDAENDDTLSEDVENKVFSDLAGFEWAEEAISSLYTKEIVNGNDNGEFLPGDKVTRAEFLKMLVCAAAITQDGGYTVPEFDDCRVTDWWYPYVGAAYSKGIANGMGTSFGAGMSITREDAVTFLGRAAEAKGKTLTVGSETGFDEDISGYALNYVIAMNDLKIVVGDENGKFNPKNTTTRAEAAVLIDRFIKWIEE